ncbi:hypothetical protein HDU67_000850 [Dinochytrium kinnereticum]|nr:hypothetical protein HDU67_000850 [Dinochytrium kinnereticum]
MANIKVSPKLAEFSNENIPLDEVISFYALPSRSEQAPVPESLERPYSWSNSVLTLDGVLHFLDPGSTVSDIALKGVMDVGHHSLADYRLLNAGWSMADGVLITGQILRDEPEASCIVSFDDLCRYRTEVLGFKEKHPINLILTESCDLDFRHPIFNPDNPLRVVILTSNEGLQKASQLLSENKGGDGALHPCREWVTYFASDIDSHNTLTAQLDAHNLIIIGFNMNQTAAPSPQVTPASTLDPSARRVKFKNGLDLTAIFKFLKKELNIQRLDAIGRIADDASWPNRGDGRGGWEV